MKRRFLTIILVSVLFLAGCAPGDLTETLYTADILPNSANTYEIGSPSNPYGSIHTQYVDITNTSSQFRGGNPTYAMTCAPLTVDGTDYDQDFDTGNHDNAYILLDKGTTNIVPVKMATEPLLVTNADGTEDWGISCFDVAGGAIYICIYFKNSDFLGGTYPGVGDRADYTDTWLDDLAGNPGVVTDYYVESIWTAGGSASDYVWANPGGKSLCTGYTDPPTFAASVGVALDIDTSTGALTAGSAVSVGGNLTVAGELVQFTGGKLLIASGAVPFIEDYGIQAFKAVSNVPGNVAGLLFGFQDGSTTDYNYQMWGIDTGMSLYGDCNYTWPVYGIQSMMRLDINNHWINTPVMVDARFTLSGGSYGAEARSNIGELTMYRAALTREGGDTDSVTQYLYGFKDAMDFDWTVDNFFGIYLKNHSAACSNSWGIYNLDDTYLGGATVLNTGEIQPVTLANASAANNSIFVDSGTGNLSYKDTTGTTHMFAWQ